MKKIILISGKSNSGKDAVADIFMKNIDGRCTKIAIARDLKYIARDYLGWNGEKGEEGREILQRTGTDHIRQKLGWMDFHVNRVYETIKIIEDYYDVIICPDIRFPNELEYLKERFPGQCMSIRIERLDFISPLTPEQQSHLSETALDNYEFDYYIKSESGLNNLEMVVTETFKNVLEEYHPLEDLIVGDEVKVTRILNTDKANHLNSYINMRGWVYSWIVIDKEKRYKVIFDDDPANTAYFRRRELKKIK